MDQRNIILVGFMGTGKTTAGERVARRLGRDLVDMDAVIEEREGKRISEIFTGEGEPHFRRLERALVRELAGREGLVVTAGGGVVLDPDNLRDFERGGTVICLQARPDVVLRRVSSETHRPLLETGEKGRRIVELLQARLPLYRAVRYQLDTSDRSPEEVAARVVEIHENDCASRPL